MIREANRDMPRMPQENPRGRGEDRSFQLGIQCHGCDKHVEPVGGAGWSNGERIAYQRATTT